MEILIPTRLIFKYWKLTWLSYVCFWMVSDIQSLSCLRKTMPLKTGFFQVMTWKLDSKVRFFNDITVAIWIPNTWIPDSSEKQAVWVSGIQMVVWLGGPFKYWTFWTGFQTTIWIPGHSTTDTNLPFEYLTSLVFRWLLYYLKTQLVKVQFSDDSGFKVSSIWNPTPIFFSVHEGLKPYQCEVCKMDFGAR